jgi:hypothetical protein
LLTPEIDLTGTTAPVLTIKHSFAVEGPDGASQFLPQLDGWDGVAVRISTDGGNTFISLAPNGGYPRSSLFGFYRTHGFNAPGWVAKSPGWVDATFNLSAYAGRKVVIRFEFGSDPGFSTEDDATLFGWRVDNLKVAEGANTIFSDDGGDTAPASMIPKLPTPNLYWHQVTTRAASPTHSWWCGNDANGRYPDYISNYLISPKIFIPPTGQNNAKWVSLHLDFQHFYNMEFTNDKVDFFQVEVSNDGGRTWNNPTGSPGYTGSSGNNWIPFEGSYSTPPFDLTNLAGDTVQFRWQFTSDYSVTNIGLFLDDPVLVGVSGLPNDVSTIDLDVAFPNIADQPTKVFVEVSNPGITDQTTVPLWYQINNNAQLPVPPLFPLPSGDSTLREFTWTPPAAGNYDLTVFTNLPSDEDRTNDTLSTRAITPIAVAPPGLAVLGYDDRFHVTFLALTSRFVHFTPKTDITSLTSYELQAVFIAFASRSTTQADQLRVIIGTAATPTTFATVLLDRVESIPAGDQSFHQFDLSAIAGAKNLTGDFLVQIDYTGSNGNGTVILDGGTRFLGHNYFFNTQAQAFQPTNLGAFVRSRIAYLTTAVEERAEQTAPQQFELYANYPNPVISADAEVAAGRAATQIRFDLPKASHVKITVFDLAGRLIATLVNERRQAGRHEVKWNVPRLPAGTYFYKLEAEDFSAIRKMLLL